jgi:hypothetical protein
MADAWGRGERDGSERTPLGGAEPRGHGADRAPGGAEGARSTPQQQGDPPSPADEAAANQERALESGEENAG